MSFSVFSQTTIRKVLSTAQTDFTVTTQRGKTNILKNASSGLPFIRDMEIRLRNDGFWEEYMRYSFRVSPKGWGEEGASRRLFTTEKKLSEQETQVKFHDALLLRYTAILEFLGNQVMNQLYKEQIVVLEDRIKVLGKSNYTTDFDLNNVITAENDLTKLRDQNIQTDKDIRMYLWKIREFLLDTTFSGFDTANLVDVEAIGERVKASVLGPDSENIHLNNFKLKYDISEKKYLLEKAMDRRYVSFASFTYDYGAFIDENDRRLRSKSYDLNARYSAELGFSLPFITADGRDNAKRESDFLWAKAEYELAKRELVEKNQRDVRDVEALIMHYRYLLARQNEVNAQGSLQKYLQMSGVNPLMLLSIKEGLLQNKLRIEKVRFDILRNYLQILDETGQLSAMPLVNYLSASKETIAQ
jgi:hypothetical protein